MGHGKRPYQRAIVTAAIITLAGWMASAWPALTRWSFDVLQLALPRHDITNVVIVTLDEQAMRDYGEQPDHWDRSIHTRLLRRLTEGQARIVVFDIFFEHPSDPAKDHDFAEAMRENGRVILAGDRAKTAPGLGPAHMVLPPYERFETNAAAWGTAEVQQEADFVVRAYDPGDKWHEDFAWAAARVAGAEVTRDPSRRLQSRRWLNYYGSSRPFEAFSMSYTNAESAAPEYFEDKAVFIGGQPETLSLGDETDVFGTPFTRWNDRSIPGVELAAIAYANLMREDWLERLNLRAELALFAFSGGLFSLGVIWRRGRIRWILATVVVIGGMLAAIALIVSSHLWFCWAAIPLIQLPCAILFYSRQREGESRDIRDTEPGKSVRDELSATRIEPTQGGLVVSDHTLVRCIGEGAYGQVWIARNAIGLCHAVKVIYRSRFGEDAPFDRAFRGLQKFMPISRSHEGFIHVLHIGRDDARGMFYYVMEAADDQQSGQDIIPERYAPKSLGTELGRRKRLPAAEGLDLMLHLTETLERLHQRQLIHRDIKPANIVYVNGHPKLADIDLVTDLSQGIAVTQIGTQGYMAPEGPGTAAADVFSLGRVLYVALTGKSPDQCPELPTRLDEYLESPHFMELMQICCRACETDLSRRYVSANAMREDLEKLHGQRRV